MPLPLTTHTQGKKRGGGGQPNKQYTAHDKQQLQTPQTTGGAKSRRQNEGATFKTNRKAEQQMSQ